jgi:hypothetical protein
MSAIQQTIQQTTHTIVQVTNVQVIMPPTRPSDRCECKLNIQQEEVVNELYDTLKETTKELFSSPFASTDHAMRIGRLMAEVMKLVEKATYKGKNIPGVEKREIALALGKCLVSDPTVISDETARGGVCTAYDILGEQLLETLLDVSRYVNVMVKEAAASCCECLAAWIKK